MVRFEHYLRFFSEFWAILELNQISRFQRPIFKQCAHPIYYREALWFGKGYNIIRYYFMARLNDQLQVLSKRPSKEFLRNI